MLPQPIPRSDFPSQGPLDLTSILEQHLRAGFQPDLALDLVLNELVIRAAEATHASSAALALLRDDQLVCRAATGNFAPDLGAPLNPREGLSGVCRRTRESQISVDTEVDPRVAVSFARRFGIRSVLSVPVFEHLHPERFAGVLEVFSATPNAFSRAEQRVLEGFAEECARVRQTAADLSERATLVELPAAGQHEAESWERDGDESEHFDAGQAMPQTPPSPVIAMPIATELPFVLPLRPPRILPAPETILPEIKVADPAPAGVRSTIGPAAAMPEVIGPAGSPPESTARPALRAPAAVSGYDHWSLALGTLAIIAIIAVSFLIGSRVGWLRATTPAQTITASGGDGEPLAPVASQPAPPPAPITTPPESPMAKTTKTTRTNSRPPRKELRAVPADKSATEAGAGELVVYEKGKVIFRMKNQTGAAKPQTSSESAALNADSPLANAAPASASKPTPPSTSGISISTTGQSTSATSNHTGAGSRGVWLNPAEAEGRLVRRVEPAYPASRGAGRAGDVTLEIDVAEDGSVSSIRTLQGDPVLAAAALQAVRNWRYQPYRVQDKPSRFHTDVTLSFALPN